MTFKQGLAVVAGGGHLIDELDRGAGYVCSRIVERVAAAPTPAAQRRRPSTRRAQPVAAS